MNPPTLYPRIAFETTKEDKSSLVNYTVNHGVSLTDVMNSLVEAFNKNPKRFKIKRHFGRRTK